MRQIWKDRLIVVFQPHRYTRTRALFEEFTKAFDEVDILILNDIYPASEEPIPGITAAALCEAIRKAGHQHVEYIPGAEATVEYLLKTVQKKDTVATIGAGSIYKIGEAFIKQLVAGEKHTR